MEGGPGRQNEHQDAKAKHPEVATAATKEHEHHLQATDPGSVVVRDAPKPVQRRPAGATARLATRYAVPVRLEVVVVVSSGVVVVVVPPETLLPEPPPELEEPVLPVVGVVTAEVF